jgi:hypothetical protein
VVGLDFCKFRPRSAQESIYSLLFQLDALADAGASHIDFCDLFCQCRRCKLILCRYVMEYHKCPVDEKELVLASSVSPEDVILRLEGVEGSGISVEAFEALFLQCKNCHGFVTKRAMSWHNCP